MEEKGRKGRKGIMLCYPFDERRLKGWKSGIERVLVQPKLDGERCRALVSGSAVTLLSSRPTVIESVPHINEALKKLNLGPVELDGELYCHGMSFEEIYSRVSRTTNFHKDFISIQYHVFDVISSNFQLERFVTLEKLFDQVPYTLEKTNSTIQLVDTTILANNLDLLMSVFDNFIQAGFEGFVVRHPFNSYIRRRSTGLMKFKPKKTDVYRIIGTQEEIDKDGRPKGALGALILESEGGEKFSVGTGLTREERVTLWQRREKVVGLYAEIKYQHTTPGRKVPRFPVYVDLVYSEGVKGENIDTYV